MTDASPIATSSPVSAWRQWFQDQRRWLFVGLVVILAAVWLGWDWLAGMGALPVLLALAPCAAMCALGLCARDGTGGACAQHPGSLPTNQDKS